MLKISWTAHETNQNVPYSTTTYGERISTNNKEKEVGILWTCDSRP